MNYRSLYDMIKYLEYGTKLHIGVLFFGGYGNYMCKLPHSQEIHPEVICELFKAQGKNGFDRCFRCRNLAIKKAMKSKAAFGGLCVNGVYEYTHPVVIDGEVACIIYIGNILVEGLGYDKIRRNIGANEIPVDSMEKNFTVEACRTVAELLEGHIRILLEKYSEDETEANLLIKNIRSYIESNLEFNIDISYIADLFHYNKRYLGRLFKKEVGMSINEYINMQRLEKAKLMLENSDDKMIEISSKAGFNNVTYFNRMFREKFQVTPTQYRKIYCKKSVPVHN